MPASRKQRAATARRRNQAMQMRIEGATWQQIADRLGYASRGAACADATRALRDELDGAAPTWETARQLELNRLDRLQVSLWPRAMAGHLPSVMAVLRLIDRRCRLLGLDLRPHPGAITIADLDAEIARLTNELDTD